MLIFYGAAVKAAHCGIEYKDGFASPAIGSFDGENLSKPVFREGKAARGQPLQETGNMLHKGEF